MGGRNAKPTALHIAEGNPNRLTKEELANRQAAEVKLGKTELDKLKPPPFVKNDAVAFAYWKQHLKDYKSAAAQGVDLLTSSDVGMLALYCKTYSEYGRLQKTYAVMEQALEDAGFNRTLGGIVESAESLIKIETAINKKMDMLIKMQDRLFLNPLAKVKNVPKPRKDEKPVSKFGKFGGGRSG